MLTAFLRADGFFPGGQRRRITAWTVTMQCAAARHFLPRDTAEKCQRLSPSLSSDYVVSGKQTRFLIHLTVNLFFFLMRGQMVCVRVQCLKIPEVSILAFLWKEIPCTLKRIINFTGTA